MIYHIALRSEWDEALAAGEYRVSTRGFGLDQVGFVHCSADLDQTGRVARAFYADCDEQLCLLTIDPAVLRAEVVHEPGDPDASEPELFPHVYGPIDLDAVVRVTDYRVPNPDHRPAE